uniref:Putative O-antigen transporter n=1 Tax=Escherichia coli TaxID=562 RepID=B5L3E9_ECOLX|nr:Wzx [Escherichia coli]
MRKNIFYLLLVQLSNYIFPLITLPYLVRTLGVDKFGYLMLGQALIQYFILMTDYGFNFSATKKIATSTSIDERNEVYTETLNAKMILVTLCLFLMLIIINIIPMFHSISIVCIILFIGVLGNIFFPVYLFQGMEKMKSIAWVTVLARTLMLLSVFLFVKDNNDINAAALAFSIALIVPGMMSIYLIRKNHIVAYKGFSFSKAFIAIKASTPLFISQIAITFYTTFNSILIGHVFNARQVGIYSAADKLRGAVQSLFIPIQQVVFPRINVERGNIKEKLKVYGGLFILFSLIICVSIFLIGDKIVILYFGTQYAESANLFKWMSVLIFIVSVAIVFSQWGMITLGREKILTKIYIVGALLHCTYAPFFTKNFGLFGTLTAVILTELTITVVMGVFLYKIIKRHK